jgi:hypothetical protein
MNCSDLQNAWDAYRDAPDALPAADRAAIEEHLRRYRACAAMRAREDAWLDILAADAGGELPSAGAFRAGVLAKWDAKRERRQNPILARIGWLLWPTLAAAAAIALAVLIGPALPGGRPNMLAAGSGRHRVHLGALVQAIGHSKLLHPGRMLGDLKKQSSELAANVGEEVAPDGSGLPDPADIFAPASGAPSSTPRG